MNNGALLPTFVCRCARPPLNEELANLTAEEWRTFSIPEGNKCEMYDVHYAGKTV